MNSLTLLALIRKGIFYCFSIGTESLIAAALLPILTHRLPPEEYGMWILFVSLFAFLRPVLSLMLQDAVRMQYFDLSPESLREHLRAALFLPSLSLAFFLLLAFLFPGAVERLLSFPGEFFWTVLVTAYLHGVLILLLAVIQFRDRHRFFLFLQVIQTVLAISLTLLFLKIENHWQAPIYARIIAIFVCDVIGLLWLGRTLGNLFLTRLPRDKLRELIHVGLGLLPVGLVSVVVPLTDRLIVTRYSGAGETGYFGIGALFGMALLVLATGLIYAWQPVLFRAVQSGNEADLNTCRRFSVAYFCFLPVAGVCAAFAAMFLAPYLVGYDVQTVRPYIAALTVAVCAECFYLHNHTMLLAYRRVREISFAAVSIMLVNALLCVLLVPRYGGMSAAWATAFTYVLATALTGVCLRRS